MGLGTIHRSVSRPVNCSMWSSCQISSSITSDRVEGLKQVPVLWNCQCNPVVDMCVHNVSIELSSYQPYLLINYSFLIHLFSDCIL